MTQNIYDNDTFFKQYEQLRSRKYNYNTLLEQPNFLALLPTLAQKTILDIGCGAGGFAAHCVTQGAKHVTAIDISANMIAAAKKSYAHEAIQFKQLAFEHMDVQEAAFDIVTSSLVFHYIADFQQLIGKISTSLREHGTLVFSMEHPIVTANKQMDSWIFDEHGNRLHYALNHYHEEDLRTQNWLVDNVQMYHRTMSTIINTLIENGLHIERIVEPMPTEAAIRLYPSIEKELRRPSFLLVRAKKASLSQ